MPRKRKAEEHVPEELPLELPPVINTVCDINNKGKPKDNDDDSENKYTTNPKAWPRVEQEDFSYVYIKSLNTFGYYDD